VSAKLIGPLYRDGASRTVSVNLCLHLRQNSVSTFDNLPADTGNELLLKLIDSKDAARAIASAVFRILGTPPENVRNELLLMLANNKDAALGVTISIAHNFGKLLEKVQNLLFNLADNKDAAIYVAVGVR
jgi:hypothetical protein